MIIKFVQFEHQIGQDAADPRIADAPRPPLRFEERLQSGIEVQHRVFAGDRPRSGGMPEQIQLRDQRDAELLSQIDQALELRLVDPAVRPTELRVGVEREHAPGFEHRVIEFVVRRQPQPLFDVPKRRLGENAQVDAAERQRRRVADLAPNEKIPGEPLRTPFDFRQLAQRFQGVEHSGATVGGDDEFLRRYVDRVGVGGHFCGIRDGLDPDLRDRAPIRPERLGNELVEIVGHGDFQAHGATVAQPVFGSVEEPQMLRHRDQPFGEYPAFIGIHLQSFLSLTSIHTLSPPRGI